MGGHGQKRMDLIRLAMHNVANADMKLSSLPSNCAGRRAQAFFIAPVLISLAASPIPRAADSVVDAKTEEPTWSEFVEPDFPFLSSVLYARALGDGWPTDNLTPRGL